MCVLSLSFIASKLECVRVTEPAPQSGDALKTISAVFASAARMNKRRQSSGDYGVKTQAGNSTSNLRAISLRIPVLFSGYISIACVFLDIIGHRKGGNSYRVM